MREIYDTLFNKDVLDNKYFIDLCSNSDSPDIILAALLASFDRSKNANGSLNVDKASPASTVSKLAITRLFSIIAETSSFEAKSIARMLCRAIVDYAQSHSAEIYEGFEVENPFVGEPEPVWIWPTIEDVEQTGGGSGPDDIWRAFSALKLFGYTVGKTKGWPTKKRRHFLSDFMEMDLPNIVTEYFDNEYGNPLTTTRLRKVAMVISNNIKSRLRQGNSKQWASAISDWTEDLDFLKEKYYDGYGLKFIPWPDSRD